MSGNVVVHLSKNNWDSEVGKAGVPVLVDFWAEWCSPCHMLAPVLEELAGELAGKMKVAKVNIDENQEIAEQFHIRSIPTLLVFKKGVVQSQMVGAMKKNELKTKLNAYL